MTLEDYQWRLRQIEESFELGEYPYEEYLQQLQYLDEEAGV